MALLSIVLPIAALVLALIAVTIYEHINSVSLSLPLSPALTIATFVLILVASVNLYLLPYLYRKPTSSPSRVFTHPTTIQVFQVFQGILTTILATLYFHDVMPSDVRDCELSNKWQTLFHLKDEGAIRAIQDALECCGLNSVRDRAFPFRGNNAIECADRYGRTLACRAPWTSALQRSAGVELGVVVAVGVLQMAGAILARRLASRFPNFSWLEALRQPFRPQRRLPGPSSRPLIRGSESRAEDADEEVGETGHENARRYGSVDERGGAGPRMEPSGLRQDDNEWRDN